MTALRTSEYPIDKQFLERWSPRAFTQQPLTEEQVLTVLEAARWAPSASNLQPWRFFLWPARHARIRHPALPARAVQ